MTDKTYQQKYYEKKRSDPEWAEKRRQKNREYWSTLKEKDPEQYARHLDRKKIREKEMREFYKNKKTK